MQYFLISIFVFFPLMAIAQDGETLKDKNKSSRSQNTQIGISSGFSFSQTNIKNFDVDEPELPIKMFTGGLTLHQQITVRWTLYAAILYEQKGFKRTVYRMNNKFENVGEPLSIDFRFHYLTVPHYINFQTAGKIKFCVGVGIYTGFLLNASLFEPYFDHWNWQQPVWEQEVLGKIKTNQTKNFYRMDYGLAMQSGMDFLLMDNLVVSPQFNLEHGFIPINKPENFGETRYINRSLSIRINTKYYF